jgi:dihydrofolate reductase
MGTALAQIRGLLIQQFLRAGLTDYLHFAIARILLGSGDQLFADVDMLKLGFQCTERVSTPMATHVVLTKRD